ncbi:MAG: hypothetical protein WCI43_07450 [Candidatus Firestonebacteria bacterium]
MASIYAALNEGNIKDIEDIIAYNGKIADIAGIKAAFRGKYSEAVIKKKLHALKTKGWLIPFKRGSYLVSDIASRGFAGISPFVIAGILLKNSYVTSGSAFSYHGLVEQLQRGVTSVTVLKRREYKFQNSIYRFKKIKSRLFFGFEKVRIEGYEAKIAVLEKALLDSLYLRRDEHSLVNIFEIFSEHRGKFDTVKLVELAEKFPVTIKRILGLMLDRAGLESESLRAGLPKTGYSRMSASAGKFDAKWRLYYDAGFDGQVEA